MPHFRLDQVVFHCAVVVPLPPLMIAKIVPALNMSLRGRFRVEMNALCLVLLNPSPIVIRISKFEECLNRAKRCGLCPFATLVIQRSISVRARGSHVDPSFPPLPEPSPACQHHCPARVLYKMDKYQACLFFGQQQHILYKSTLQFPQLGNL